MLRQWNYKDYYHPNMTVQEEKHLGSHIGMSLPLFPCSLSLHHDAVPRLFVAGLR